MKANKKGIKVFIVLLILAVLGFFAYPVMMFYYYPGNHTRFHVTFTVDGKPYTPQKADFFIPEFNSYDYLLPTSFSANGDGTVDFAIRKEKYGSRHVCIRIDGMDEPLFLKTGVHSCNVTIKYELQINVDTKTKTADITGEYTSSDDISFKPYPHIEWESEPIDTTLDLTLNERGMPRIANTI